jgi:hypothetical protein
MNSKRKKMNEIRKIIQGMKEEFNKDIEILTRNKPKFWK